MARKNLVTVAKLALAGTGLVGTTSLLAGCGPMAVLKPVVDPGPANPFVQACVWPDDASRITYRAANGDLYDVRTSPSGKARVRARTNGGQVFVTTTYTDMWNTKKLTDFGKCSVGLCIQDVDVNGLQQGVYLPSTKDLLSNTSAYYFRQAGDAALTANYKDLSQRPQQFCGPANDIQEGSTSDYYRLPVRDGRYYRRQDWRGNYHWAPEHRR